MKEFKSKENRKDTIYKLEMIKSMFPYKFPILLILCGSLYPFYTLAVSIQIGEPLSTWNFSVIGTYFAIILPLFIILILISSRKIKNANSGIEMIITELKSRKSIKSKD
jgi:hypothetical protein